MVRFKVFGAFLAFVYSFFFYTLTHINDYSVQEKTFAESQIRSIEKRSDEGIISLFRGVNTVKAIPVRGQPALNSKGITFNIDNINTIKSIKIRIESSILYRTIATERFRVLRN